MYFKIIRKGKILTVGDDLLGFSINYTIGTVPTFRVTLPIKYFPYLNYRNELEIYFDDETYIHGLISIKTIDTVNETMEVDYDHILYEWTYESVPTNVVKKFRTIYQLYNDEDIKYNSQAWEVRVRDDFVIDFEFSRETKLQALDKIISLTPDLHYRVLRDRDRYIEIGKFGDIIHFPVTIDNIVESLTITDDGSNIVNYCVALSDKNDGGATSTTLRDVYLNPELQLEGFPVVLTGNLINTQSAPSSYETVDEDGNVEIHEFPELAPNSSHEFAVKDLEGIALEDGDIYEGTFTSNAIQPVQEDGNVISNEDRIKASETLYHSAIRLLRQSRRSVLFTVNVDNIPWNLNVGDRIPVAFSNTHSELTACLGERLVEIINEDRYLYVTTINVTLDADGFVSYQLELSPNLDTLLSGREV